MTWNKFDAELADTREAQRLRRVKRVRAACTTVPSIDADEHAARIVSTIESLEMSASGGPSHGLPAHMRRRGKEAPPSPRTPTTFRPLPTPSASLATPPGSPNPTADDEGPNTTSNGGASGHQRC